MNRQPSKSFWASKKVLVTGATGLVGSWLVKWLVESGSNVVAFVADMDPATELLRSGQVEQVSVVNGRLEEYEDVARAINNHEVDTLFHLGAQPIVSVAHRSPRHTFEANIRGTWNVLDACRSLSPLVERIILASSDKAYGIQNNLPYHEQMSMNGSHPYEVSKSCADLIAVTYAKTYGLPVTIARCGNIYGGGDLNWNRIVPGTIRSLLAGEQPVLRSDGTFLRDYLFVDDVIKAYLLLGEKSSETDFKGEAFNFSNEQPMTVMEIYGAICEVVSGRAVSPLILNRATGEIRDQYLDSSKSHRILDWYASVPLREGLERTVSWYREFLGQD